MRTLLQKAEALGDVLWKELTEGRELTTPERRAGLEAELARVVTAIRDAKIAEYYRRDFDERVFKAFKQRLRPPARGGNARRDGAKGRAWTGRSGLAAGAPEEGVSSAVKRSLHAVNAQGAARQIKERELMGLLVASPGFWRSPT
jgi:DNA primase